MIALLFIHLIAVATAIFFEIKAYRRRNKDKPYFSFSNPFSPFRYREWFSPSGYRYFLTAKYCWLIAAVSTSVYWLSR
ncbi:MAG: hypothetical protein ACE5FH_06360 [Candidatus Zixiibacteriota bacterium]